MREIYVSKNCASDFTTIQQAIDSVRVFSLEPVVIYIARGIYHEKVTIPDNKPTIHLIGESKESTIISYNEYAEMTDENENKLGTFRTAVLTSHADDFQLENISLRNTAGYGKEIGQALALYLAGDRCMITNVALNGNQDTLYTSKGRHYFKNCNIEGHVDFIFGSATAVFDQCVIHSLRAGYVTAAATSESQKFGFVFFNCKLTGAAEDETVYLGRPWRPHAHTVFIRCWLGKHIKREGWSNWRNSENERTARYSEYNSSGPGALPIERAKWSSQLSAEEVKHLTINTIFCESSSWLPIRY